LPILVFACGCNDQGLETNEGELNGSSDTGEAWWSQSPGDADGDGFTVKDGDCDDGNDTVHPGVDVDRCDGLDSDCDGEIDEDFDLDSYEPNDTDPAWTGSLSDEEQTQFYGYVFDQDDVDRFDMEIVESSFAWFDLEVWLYGTPKHAEYQIELFYTEGATRQSIGSDTASGRGSMAFINYGGTTGVDDSGRYEVEVRSLKGSSCAAPYTVHVLLGSW
jgi:hypothetical protein